MSSSGLWVALTVEEIYDLSKDKGFLAGLPYRKATESDIEKAGYVSQFAMKGLMEDRAEVVNCWWIQKLQNLMIKFVNGQFYTIPKEELKKLITNEDSQQLKKKQNQDSGKQGDERRDDVDGSKSASESVGHQRRGGNGAYAHQEPAQKTKPHGLKVIDGSPSSIAKWIREQEEKEVDKEQ